MKNIKGSVHQLVTRAAKSIWPEKRSMPRGGVLVFGICALLGVSQASNVQKMIFGSAESESVTQKVQNAVTSPTPAERKAYSVTPAETEQDNTVSSTPNIVDLIDQSDLILRGSVKSVTDGIENGVPYTEIKLTVTEGLRGQFGDEYSFRQFGLLKPRKMENGKVNLNMTPEGWSKYNAGEDVVLFLYKQASMTGLRTTVGLGQGKMEVRNGNVSNEFDNEGLFENVQVESKLVNERDERVLATKTGPVNAESFMSFVRRAVNEKWVEGRKMRNEKK